MKLIDGSNVPMPNIAVVAQGDNGMYTAECEDVEGNVSFCTRHTMQDVKEWASAHNCTSLVLAQ